MSATLLLALLIQLAAVILMRFKVGSTWLQRPTPILLVAAVLYQGVSEVLLAFPAIRAADAFRIGIQQHYVDDAALLCAVGLLAMTVCYLLLRPERVHPRHTGWEVTHSKRLVKWRPIMLACVPLAIISYHGGGFSKGINPTTSLSSNLAAEFLVPLITLGGLGMILRYGERWYVPVLLTQSVLIAAVGWRSPVVANFVVLFVMLSYVRKRPSRNQVLLAMTVTAMAILTMTVSRSVVGRQVFVRDSGFAARVSAIGTGLTAMETQGNSANSTNPSIIAQFATRFDGNAYAGGILQDMAAGQRPIGVDVAAKSVLLVVPHVLWQSKDSSPSILVPTAVAQSVFGIQNINFLAPLPAFYLGFIGPFWMLVFMAVFGVGCALGERWVFRRFSVVRMLFLAGGVMAALTYEAGLPSMLSQLRTVAVMAIVVKVAELTIINSRTAVAAESKSQYRAQFPRMIG